MVRWPVITLLQPRISLAVAGWFFAPHPLSLVTFPQCPLQRLFSHLQSPSSWWICCGNDGLGFSFSDAELCLSLAEVGSVGKGQDARGLRWGPRGAPGLDPTHYSSRAWCTGGSVCLVVLPVEQCLGRKLKGECDLGLGHWGTGVSPWQFAEATARPHRQQPS